MGMTTDPREAPPKEDEGDTGRDLVQSIELLNQMIDKNEEALRADTQAGMQDPGLEDNPWYRTSTLPGAEAQQTFDEIFDAPVENFWEGESPPADMEMEDGTPDNEALKQELIAELKALIDVGLRRVTETARQALASEFAVREPVSAPKQDPQGAPPAPGSLAQALSETWNRLRFTDVGSGAFFSTLEREAEQILHDGLEQIRRNLESAVQSTVSAHTGSGSPGSAPGEPDTRPPAPGGLDPDAAS